MDDMKLNGLKLSAEDIYSVNKSSLKDAVLRFGGGCTGEMISSQGLLLTNHHCGYGTIQSHSSVENDYLTDGYWAKTMADELPNPGLIATFIIRIEDVTDQLLSGIDESTDKGKLDSIFNARSNEVIKNAVEGSHYEAFIRPFYNGNQFILFVTETFKDVRLVGAPPSSIGKYGFDTDNWVWPRHTGDFSIFRIYADKDNNPAEFSEDNVPFKPRHHFPISLDGYEEGDFTMVYGFPYRTEEYLISDAVDYIMNVSNPTKIEIRDRKLEVLGKKMMESDEVRIKYAAKQSSTSNAWKKWKGQNKGLKRNKALEKKRELEEEMQTKIAQNPESFGKYEGLLNDLKEQYKAINEVALARDYYVEIAYYGTDALRKSYGLISLIDRNNKGKLTEKDIESLENMKNSSFKNYDHETDLAVFKAIMPIYFSSEDNFYKPAYIKEMGKKHGGDLDKWLEDVYNSSVLTDPDAYTSLFQKNDYSKALKKIEKDELYIMAYNLYTFYKNQISPAYSVLQAELDEMNKNYMNALMDIFPDKQYYPDANGTLRLTFGKIQGMNPSDAVEYGYYTTLEGVVAKHDTSSYEYSLPEKLIELYENKDYGRYAHGDEMRVCFIASNHTSGGNSGSPVINGEGELIGLNFDRNWEGTMSDINYDINQCRNISVDIRYVLFIIDKFAGATRLVDEMTIATD